MKILGTPVPKEKLVDTFPAPEGSANFYYGQIRSGKTYGATADIIEELKRGRLVYATWPIHLENFDDRDSFFVLFFNMLLFRKRHYVIPCADNFHYIDAEKGEVDGVPTFDKYSTEAYIQYLNTLNHCSLYIDEAWRVVDSYVGTRATVNSRNLILVTGHKFRTVNLIAQRPTSVAAWARGNMNRYYKFVKLFSFFGIPRFARYEFQEMVNETVDETLDPISKKVYWGKKSIFNSYNSWFYGEQKSIHNLNLEAYDLTFLERLRALARKAFRPSGQRPRGGVNEITTSDGGDDVAGLQPKEGYTETASEPAFRAVSPLNSDSSISVRKLQVKHLG